MPPDVPTITIEQAYRIRAEHDFADDNLQIDPDADVSIGVDGAWVEAWVFVPKR